MKRSSLGTLLVAVVISLAAPSVGADDTPKGLWLKVKCALCHGEDGSGDTPTGKKTNAPDLRAAKIQQLNNDQLEKLIEEGHAKMPSFKIQLTKDQIKTLVYYIRDLGSEDANKSSSE